MGDFDSLEREIESIQRVLYEMNKQIEYQTRIMENTLERIARSLESISSSM